jgi:hypothetical protein
VVYSSGSNVFGNNIANTQVFTGSMNLTGSLTVVTTGTEFQVNANGVKFGNVIGDAHSITGSVGISGSLSGVGATFSGDVGIGTTSPQRQLTINSSFPALQFTNPTTGTTSNDGLLIFQSGLNGTISNQESGSLSFETNNTFRATITSGGDVFINNPSGVSLNSLTNKLSISSTTYNLLDISRFSDNTFGPNFYLVKSRNASIGGNTIVANGDNLGNITWVGATGGTGFADAANIRTEVDGTPGTGDMPGRLVFSTTADGASSTTERMRITSGGTIISQGSNIVLGSNNNASFSSTTAYTLFIANAGSEGSVAQGQIAFGEVTGYGINTNRIGAAITTVYTDTYSRLGLVFKTKNSADDAGPVERMRITSGGSVLFQKTAANNTDTGVVWFPNDYFCVTNNSADSGDRVVLINRQNSDGTLIDFRQANVNEGSISVSGTTVSYNGGHLSRYSQTELNQKIEGLLKGTVMSNLDKMAQWINPETGEPYANEQLNCMKISDVEGDKNVAGVFVNWEYDSELLTNDMNIAMTGDMIIRIAQGLVVEKGDLLMSTGDGTAKPQEDDIIRSKTIAKVTSNHITCVYEDGSYCVPCVLMAC